MPGSNRGGTYAGSSFEALRAALPRQLRLPQAASRCTHLARTLRAVLRSSARRRAEPRADLRQATHRGQKIRQQPRQLNTEGVAHVGVERLALTYLRVSRDVGMEFLGICAEGIRRELDRVASRLLRTAASPSASPGGACTRRSTGSSTRSRWSDRPRSSMMVPPTTDEFLSAAVILRGAIAQLVTPATESDFYFCD